MSLEIIEELENIDVFVLNDSEFVSYLNRDENLFANVTEICEYVRLQVKDTKVLFIDFRKLFDYKVKLVVRQDGYFDKEKADLDELIVRLNQWITDKYVNINLEVSTDYGDVDVWQIDGNNYYCLVTDDLVYTPKLCNEYIEQITKQAEEDVDSYYASKGVTNV